MAKLDFHGITSVSSLLINQHMDGVFSDFVDIFAIDVDAIIE
ncbi:hypothetical protein MED92_08331 [Oceanospirillum sp. MED92]|uniref:Uncharacterized protein n=1 Tax=Neptuniibacter caesariensis TaxID=207954 RepID=A0A7U8GUA1_NEPCE|nr:hypothetical protein MED92_08331 [Oceanospirillum sp. MED92] [Neptuniibacter caesariensis]